MSDQMRLFEHPPFQSDLVTVEHTIELADAQIMSPSPPASVLSYNGSLPGTTIYKYRLKTCSLLLCRYCH
jgi:hypothetical protein